MFKCHYSYLDLIFNNCYISPVAVEALLFIVSFIDLNVAKNFSSDFGTVLAY